LPTQTTFPSNFMSDSTLRIATYLQQLPVLFPELRDELPWNIPGNLEAILRNRIKSLSDDYHVHDDVAIHPTARIEDHVILKGPMIISAGSFIGAHAYLRGGVYLGENSVIGPGCEVKSSIILNRSALAHFNFVGDSLVGDMVNFEAGSIVANHFNEREDKTIFVLIDGKRTSIGVTKFGAMVGDFSRIGANAVLSPGTILTPKSVVPRLSLIEQC